MPIPQSLQDRLRKHQIVPFVGAGVSMNVVDRDSHQPVFPGWRQLLNGAADRLEKELKPAEAGVVRAILRLPRPDFLYAAQQAREALVGVWFEFLRDALDVRYERIDKPSLELARSIWRLGSNLVITTNYDKVLSWASPQERDLQSWDIEAPVQQALLLRGELRRPVIWHLHGEISNPSGMILSRDGYDLLYPANDRAAREAHYDAALATLRQLAIAKSFLFVGFSLDDAHLGYQLKSVHEMYKGAGQHFALVPERDAERIRNLNMGIEPIIFEDFGEPLLTLVSELAELLPSEEKIPDLQTSASERPIVIPDYGPHRSVFYVPFKQKGDEIVGQQQVLAEVRKQLTEGKRTAIGQTAAFRGLGGLGKTQLAIEYAYRFRDSYPNGVIWINADQDIDAQLIDIAEKARWIAPQSDHKYKVELAQQRIRSYSNCLIVFDNLDDRAAIESYLPEPEATPHILVTSRTDHVGFQPIALDPLDQALSRELLVKEAGREPDNEDEEKAVQRIVGLLGGLPLALELLGAYLGHRRSVTFQQYYELLSKDLKSALPKHVESFTKHEADLYSTLRLSQGLLREEPYLGDVLDLLTWSGSAPMSTDFMSQLLDLSDESALTGSLALGAELRLLQRSEKSNSYSLHRLVGEVRRGEIPLEHRLEWVDAICRRLGDWFQDKREEFSNLITFESEIDHLKTWQEHAREFAQLHSSRLKWLQAYPAYHRGRYLESRRHVIEAQRILNQQGNSNPELQAHLLNDLAYTNLALSELDSVLEMFTQALRIRRELFGDQHADIATSLSNLAWWYGDEEENIELAL
ncbi:MAG TPA: SIR2 family protein, partial [Pyrinomonadaceae bacterium]|nr:SIR2 family protein [Pyrinomonadaceae bacterium]